MPFQQISNRIAAHPAALFEDAVIHPPLYLEKNRCINIVVVKTEPKFETVFIPIDGPPVKLQIVRVEVKAVDWIRVIRLAHPILVQLKIRAHELPDLESGFFADDVLLLEARRLQLIILWHRSFRLASSSQKRKLVLGVNPIFFAETARVCQACVTAFTKYLLRRNQL